MKVNQFTSRTRGALPLLAAVLLFACAGLAAQTQRQPPLSDSRQQSNKNEDAWQIQQRTEMLKKYNLQRQEEIKKDTAKLLELATELKQAVEKSNENMLSVDVVKKAEQIEKLAKTVKDKMKGP